MRQLRLYTLGVVLQYLYTSPDSILSELVWLKKMKSLQDQHGHAFRAYASCSSLISLLWFYAEHDHGHGRGHAHNHDRYDRSPPHHYDHACDTRVGPRQLLLPT
jgi:hypothetical protein